MAETEWAVEPCPSHMSPACTISFSAHFWKIVGSGSTYSPFPSSSPLFLYWCLSWPVYKMNFKWQMQSMHLSLPFLKGTHTLTHCCISLFYTYTFIYWVFSSFLVLIWDIGKKLDLKFGILLLNPISFLCKCFDPGRATPGFPCSFLSNGLAHTAILA